MTKTMITVVFCLCWGASIIAALCVAWDARNPKPRNRPEQPVVYQFELYCGKPCGIVWQCLAGLPKTLEGF